MARRAVVVREVGRDAAGWSGGGGRESIQFRLGTLEGAWTTSPTCSSRLAAESWRVEQQIDCASQVDAACHIRVRGSL